MFVMMVNGFVDGDFDRVRMGYMYRNGLFDLIGNMFLDRVRDVLYYGVGNNFLYRNIDFSLNRNGYRLVYWYFDGVRLWHTDKNRFGYIHLNWSVNWNCDVLVQGYSDRIFDVTVFSDRKSMSLETITMTMSVVFYNDILFSVTVTKFVATVLENELLVTPLLTTIPAKITMSLTLVTVPFRTVPFRTVSTIIALSTVASQIVSCLKVRVTLEFVTGPTKSRIITVTSNIEASSLRSLVAVENLCLSEVVTLTAQVEIMSTLCATEVMSLRS